MYCIHNTPAYITYLPIKHICLQNIPAYKTYHLQNVPLNVHICLVPLISVWGSRQTAARSPVCCSLTHLLSKVLTVWLDSGALQQHVSGRFRS